MNKIKTLFVVSLLLTCLYIPCIAAAGNNDGLHTQDAQVDRTVGQAHAGMGVAADAQATRRDSRDELQRAREVYRNDKTPENQQMLMDAAKDYLLQMLDLMIGRLTLLQERIEFAEKNNILVPDGASENIDRYIIRFEGYEIEVRSADTAADIRSVARSINHEWRSSRREILHCTKYMLASRIELYLEKANNIYDRLDVKIGELEDEDVDTTNLRQNQEDFKEALVCIEENYELAKEAVSDDEINSGEVRQYIRNASRCIREANNLLRDMFRELRALEGYMDGAVILTGTGSFDASGSGTAWLHGSLDLALVCDSGTLMVRDRAGDMEIAVTGNGVKGQSGRWTVYHGFDGTADITGSDVSVVLVGSGVDLTVTGTGRAILVGDGTYQVKGSGGDMISSGDWQEPRDGYEIGVDESVSEEGDSTGDDLLDEAEDETAVDDTANEPDSGTDDAGDGDTDTSNNETESGTDDNGATS
ncbi:MAG: hypothetical protein C4B59_09235 [Candidatus Methanogaster sp.]|uniref:Uncharacterized protein n=1 Tax=Candidatus Methanogaster sp. TaxID=3386292 RepID=A0AC61L290_9EURY|nr:MAG: hypothetical protein C4B59_09235 [ANME-2 cluster archaeon]